MNTLHKFLLVGALGAGTLGLAAGGAHAMARHHGPLGHLAAALDLSDEQRDQVRAELRKDWPTLKPEIRAVVDGHRELCDAIHAGAGERDIRAKAERLAAAEGDLAVHAAALRNRIAPLLTDAQRAKLDRLHGIMRREVDDRLEMADVLLGR